MKVVSQKNGKSPSLDKFTVSVLLRDLIFYRYITDICNFKLTDFLKIHRIKYALILVVPNIYNI